MRTVQSEDPVTMVLPSGDQASALKVQASRAETTRKCTPAASAPSFPPEANAVLSRLSVCAGFTPRSLSV
jgi:hypothetical protein